MVSKKGRNSATIKTSSAVLTVKLLKATTVHKVKEILRLASPYAGITLKLELRNVIMGMKLAV